MMTGVNGVIRVTGVTGELRVMGASKIGGGEEGEVGGGEDVTMAGQTNKQGKIELLSHWTMEG